MVFYDSKYGSLEDISLGGFSFSAVTRDAGYAEVDETGKEEELDVVYQQQGVTVSDLPVEVVYTYHVPVREDEIKTSCYRKYYGVRFTGLSSKQYFKIKSLILKGTYF